MRKKVKKMIIRRAAPFAAALTVAALCVCASAGMTCAKETAADPGEETIAFLVNEDGSETQISQESLAQLRENSMPEIPDVIDVIVDDPDQGFSLYPDMSGDGTDDLITADEDAEYEELLYAADSDVSDFAVEEMTDEENVFENEETAPDPAKETDAEGLIVDEPAQETDAYADAAEENNVPLWGDGNVERMDFRALIGRKGPLSNVYDAIAGEAAGMEGKTLLAGNTASVTGAVGSGYYNINITQSGSLVTVTGTINAPYSFYGLFVDTTLVSPVTGGSVNQTVNMDKFPTGYHTVCLGIIQNGVEQIMDVVGRKFMVSNILVERPSYNGRFEVYSNYFVYYPYNMALENQEGKLYIEYSANGGKTWETFGYMQANMIKLYIEQAWKIVGLRPKTKYLTRIRYGVSVTYSEASFGDGNSYIFYGPALNTTTIRTGAAKGPAIRSVTAKAVNVKYHQIRHYGRYTGVYLYTERFYTCRIKVTVKLKRKPGTNGLFINGAWLRGNKKTYSKVFSPYPNYYVKHPRGHYRYSVSIRSGQSGVWGGYSPTRAKNPKLS